MQVRPFRRLGTVLAGVAVSAMAFSGTADAAARTISVPDDFVAGLSGTRPTGSYQVEGTGLRIRTQGSTSTDKVAEYVATSTPLSGAGEPSLAYTNTAGGVPGFQLVVDFDDDGSSDGILVGEPGSYGNDWWLTNDAEPFVKAGAPTTGGGSGSPWHGTLDQWRAAFPGAVVTAFGFSLGSGVEGDGVLNAITFAGDTYTFVAPVVLTGKDACKKGGWATSTKPVFRNQGDCVSSFSSAR